MIIGRGLKRRLHNFCEYISTYGNTYCREYNVLKDESFSIRSRGRQLLSCRQFGGV